MAELYTKTKDGQFKKIADVGNDQAHQISNEINKEDLKKELANFWTAEKSGKHKDIASKHGTILIKDLLVKPGDFFEQANKNKFIFSEFRPIPLSKFLQKAKLDSFVKPEYVEDCLKVVTSQPAIGKGEFLLVSCFKNINFNKESGDLIDSEGHRVEVKGARAALGSTYSGNYKTMSKDLTYSIFSQFDTNPGGESLTIEAFDDLEKLLKNNGSKLKDVMNLLQNTDYTDRKVLKEMIALFNQVGHLKEIVAASHLYQYLKNQEASYLIALNDKMFAGFKSPSSVKEAYIIIKDNFKVTGWTSGNSGISITLK